MEARPPGQEQDQLQQMRAWMFSRSTPATAAPLVGGVRLQRGAELRDEQLPRPTLRTPELAGQLIDQGLCRDTMALSDAYLAEAWKWERVCARGTLVFVTGGSVGTVLLNWALASSGWLVALPLVAGLGLRLALVPMRHRALGLGARRLYRWALDLAQARGLSTNAAFATLPPLAQLYVRRRLGLLKPGD